MVFCQFFVEFSLLIIFQQGFDLRVAFVHHLSRKHGTVILRQRFHVEKQLYLSRALLEDAANANSLASFGVLGPWTKVAQFFVGIGRTQSGDVN